MLYVLGFTRQDRRTRKVAKIGLGRRRRDGLLPTAGESIGQVERRPAKPQRHLQDCPSSGYGKPVAAAFLAWSGARRARDRRRSSRWTGCPPRRSRVVPSCNCVHTEVHASVV